MAQIEDILHTSCVRDMTHLLSLVNGMIVDELANEESNDRLIVCLC